MHTLPTISAPRRTSRAVLRWLLVHCQDFTAISLTRSAPRACQLIRAMPEIVFRLESIASILSRKVQLDARQTASSKQVSAPLWTVDCCSANQLLFLVDQLKRKAAVGFINLEGSAHCLRFLLLEVTKGVSFT